jgi:signal transduction histidine kinase
LRPIRQLTGLATQLKEGDYQFPPIEAGRDEIGVLAREFTGMADAIRDRDGLLRRQKGELEDAYRALVEAQRAQVQAERLAAVGEISSRITHELRNPLSSIGLNVEMLVDELEHDGREGDAVEMLRAIEREVQRLTELTDRYLSMARTDAERRVDATLGDLVDDVAGQLRPELERAGVRLDRDAAADLSVHVDPAQLRQVLINLVQNSVGAIRSAGARGGRIRIQVTGGETHACCRIEDDGPGIEVAIADQVFEPFVTSREGGTGLGLSISRRIVEDHGGELSAGTSTELGGASFEIRLPRAGD